MELLLKRFKALLVLETDEDYVRFGIPQDRLTPILTVTSTGVALTDRQSLPLRPLPTGLTPQELTQITGFSEYNDTNTSQTCEVGQSECQLQVPRCYEKKLRQNDVLFLLEFYENICWVCFQSPTMILKSLGCDGGDETKIESKGQTVLQKTCFTGLASLKD